MKDPSGTSPKLIEETAILKQRVKELEQSESERNREEALIRANDEWGLIFDAIPDLIALIDTDYRIILANRAMATRLGCTPEQIEGCYCYEAVHGLTAPPGFCPHAMLLASGKEEQVEVAEERLGGIFNVSATPLRNEAGQLVGSVHVARNITDIKQAEKALQKREALYKYLSNQLETILDHIPGLVFYKDTKNNFIRVNKYVALSHGKTKEELEGKNLFDLYPREDAEKYYQDDLMVINSGVPQLNIEEPWKTPEGQQWVITSKIPFTDAVGKIIGVIGFAYDITERKRLEKELDAYNRQLEDRIRRRTDELQRVNERLIQEIKEHEESSKSLLETKKEVDEKANNLEKMNTALGVLLKHREADRENLANNVTLSVKQLIMPYINDLKNGSLNARHKMLVEMIEAGLKDISSPFTGKLSVAYMDLTPREIQVANLIKQGKNTKDIADFMGISSAAVNLHRNHLRGKLGLKNKKTNLFAFLSSLS